MRGSLRGSASILLLIFVGTAGGQEITAPKSVCFRAKPVTQCRTFLVTEFGVRYVPARNSAGDDFSNRLLVPISIGWMTALDARSAFGAAAGLEPDVQYSDWRLAVGPRYRFWITDHATVDGGVDVAVAGGGIRSVTIHGTWMYREMLGFQAGMVFDRVNDAYTRERVAPFFGVRLGSYAGSSAILGTAALYTLISALYVSD